MHTSDHKHRLRRLAQELHQARGRIEVLIGESTFERLEEDTQRLLQQTAGTLHTCVLLLSFEVTMREGFSGDETES